MTWLGILGLILVVLSALGVALAIFLHRKAAAVRRAFDVELQQEPAIVGPENGIYRGSLGSYPQVAGNGLMALTDKRLLFRKFVGVGIDVALADVAGVSVQSSWNGGIVAGKVHLIVHTRQGDVAYFTRDTERWKSEIERRLVR